MSRNIRWPVPVLTQTPTGKKHSEVMAQVSCDSGSHLLGSPSATAGLASAPGRLLSTVDLNREDRAKLNWWSWTKGNAQQSAVCLCRASEADKELSKNRKPSSYATEEVTRLEWDLSKGTWQLSPAKWSKVSTITFPPVCLTTQAFRFWNILNSTTLF